MTISKNYEVTERWLHHSHINTQQYKNLYKESVENPDLFWSKQAEEFIDWEKKWKEVSKTNMQDGQVAWFLGATLNVAQNCLDRHLQTKSDKIAIFAS